MKIYRIIVTFRWRVCEPPSAPKTMKLAWIVMASMIFSKVTVYFVHLVVFMASSIKRLHLSRITNQWMDQQAACHLAFTQSATPGWSSGQHTGWSTQQITLHATEPAWTNKARVSITSADKTSWKFSGTIQCKAVWTVNQNLKFQAACHFQKRWQRIVSIKVHLATSPGLTALDCSHFLYERCQKCQRVRQQYQI